MRAFIHKIQTYIHTHTLTRINITTLSVVIWSIVLGGVQSWKNALPWSSSTRDCYIS